jgi:LuxR family quorum-sensing system transcriptional regulator SolR
MRSGNTLELISSITSVTTEAELLEKMKAVARAIGYDQVLFGIEMRIPGGAPVQHITSGYPMEYQVLYQTKAFLTRDPTVAHAQTSTRPLVWCEQMYTQDSYEIMEEASRFGLGNGLSLPVHETGRVVSMLSLARDKPLDSEEERRHVVAAGNVLAHCVHVASENLILPGVIASRRPHLSPREQQCFQLVALGKSNWEIGQHLKISGETAAVHVKSVLKKLGVSTRMQAVAIGVALGMIKP